MTNVICQACKYYLLFQKCKAFPDGIPKKILTSEQTHDKPIKGQTGYYVFEEVSELPKLKDK